MKASSEFDLADIAIAASRERCEREYKLVRDSAHPILRLQSSEVLPRFEEMVERTGGRNGVFRQLAEIVAAAGQCLVVSDVDGILIRFEGVSDDNSDFENYGIALGSCWDERSAGTNGVALALSQNRPITVRGTDHFFSTLHPFACTAAPLLDAENQVIGAVNLSAIDRGNAAEYIFARQLLGVTADKIQRLLFEKRFGDAMILSVQMPEKKTLISGNDLIAVNEAGAIVGSTARVHSFVNLNDPSALLGQSFEALFGADAGVLDRIPERVLSVRRETGPALDFSVRKRAGVGGYGTGWRPEHERRSRKTIRRRLPPSLREISVGSEKMAAIVEQAEAHFTRALPFIIEGESGTGKSALIAALHETSSARKSEPLAIDCASLGESADDQNFVTTILDQARAIDTLDDCEIEATTLIFDNVDEMPDHAQARLRNLLSAMEAGDRIANVNAPFSALRIVATSRKSVEGAVLDGRFRDDLYYLLANASIELPPLRVRERIGELCFAIASELTGLVVDVTEDALDMIAAHDWPGNTRELRNVLRQALLAGDGQRISPVELSAASVFGPIVPSRLNKQTFETGSSLTYGEEAMVRDALIGTHWNVSKAARKLGIGRATIHRKMKQYGLSRPT